LIEYQSCIVYAFFCILLIIVFESVDLSQEIVPKSGVKSNLPKSFYIPFTFPVI
jgi:hypothetical protein